MKKHFLNAMSFLAFFSLALWTTGCSDDDGFADVDGQSPAMTLTTDHIQSAAGRSFTIEGTLTDTDGIASISLVCPDLYLNKTIDLIEIYGEPQTTYELSYSYNFKANELGESFTVTVTVTDVGGRQVSQDVLVTMDGDFESPIFTVEPAPELTVLIAAETGFTLNFSASDDRALDYVVIDIPGLPGFENYQIDAEGQKERDFSERITFPSEEATYEMTLTVVDKVGNQESTVSVINVSEMQNFPKMYLADVATTAELNSDVFGVPMVINHPAEYQYRARYYNKTAGTEIFFLPQKTDFAPICFGLDPNDNTKLTYDPETAQPIVLEEAGVYYEIDFNVLDLTYSMRTYSVDEATNPMKYEYGSNTFWDADAQANIAFYIGWGGDPKDAGNHLFVQDEKNPHLFYYPAEGATWTQEAGEMNFIITNYHPSGWWDNVEWRCDNSTEPEKFGYFSKAGDVNPNWEGVNQKWEDGSAVLDNWVKPTVSVTGNYRFEFDAHLGRGKIVPAN